jgi:hypothetical protein
MATYVRALEVEQAKLAECTTIQQMMDAYKPRFKSSDLIGKPIQITSVRGRKSDYKRGLYAVAGFRSDELGDGQFKIGGFAGKFLLGLNEDDLPVTLILRWKESKRSKAEYPKWERA